ncbi:MAG: hypothetical protein O2880_03605 [Proteobacteria bacterium]|nr:hypothetical protein [Pseudomonadota bacterium]
MSDRDSYTISEAEARRMRRGAFLPVLLVVPLALMFGLDKSKSQPMHLLMTFVIASGIAAVIVSIGWYGAKRRIAEFSHIILTVTENRLVWSTGARRTELNLDDVTMIDVQETRGSIRSIILRRSGSTNTTLEGYERMDDLLERICDVSSAAMTRSSRWFDL